MEENNITEINANADLQNSNTAEINDEKSSVSSKTTGDNGKLTIVCDQCGSTDVTMETDDFGVCNHCGAKFKIQDRITNNFAQNYNFNLNVDNNLKNESSQFKMLYFYCKPVTDFYDNKKLVKECAKMLQFSTERHPADFISNAEIEIEEGYSEFMATEGVYSGSVSCLLGYYRKEQTYEKDGDDLVLVTRRVTDWKPYTTSFSKQKTISRLFHFVDDAIDDAITYNHSHSDRIQEFIVNQINNNQTVPYFDYVKTNNINYTPKEISMEKIINLSYENLYTERLYGIPKSDDFDFDSYHKNFNCDELISAQVYIVPYKIITFKNGSYSISYYNVGGQTMGLLGNRCYLPPETKTKDKMENKISKKMLKFDLSVILMSIIHLLLDVGTFIKFASGPEYNQFTKFVAAAAYITLPILIILFIVDRVIYSKYRSSIMNSAHQNRIDNLKQFLSKNNLPELDEEDMKDINNLKISVSERSSDSSSMANATKILFIVSCIVGFIIICRTSGELF